MPVVQEGPPDVHGTSAPPDPTGAELLFKEARQRERRRRLVWLVVIVIVVGGVAAAVASIISRSPPSPRPAAVPSSSRPRPPGLSIGPVVPLRRAGPLAVGPTGALYVSDPTRHQVLVRLADGRFRVVVGDGRVGFAGDGGPATRAEVSNVSALAFGPDGDLYLADGARVRVVDREGTIRTVAGNGHVGSVADGTPALSAALGPVGSIALSPQGELYIATADVMTAHVATSQLLRLTAGGRLESVPAVLPRGQVQVSGALDSFGSIAIDAEGNVYASSIFDGWSVFEIAPDGVATYLGYARRSGGTTAILQRGPGGVIELDDNENMLRVLGNQLVPTVAVNTVPGINTFVFTDFFALAPDGTLYADNLGPPAFEPFQQIVSITDGVGVSLWRGAART